MTKNIDMRQLLLNEVSDHVSEQFGLNEDYRITNFKAKDTSITLDSVNYEITVKCKAKASEDIHSKVYEAEKEWRKQREAEEEFAE